MIVIEHDLDVIAHADWVVDPGPEGGSDGGRLLFQGTPADLLDTPVSHTAGHLRRALIAGCRQRTTQLPLRWPGAPWPGSALVGWQCAGEAWSAFG